MATAGTDVLSRLGLLCLLAVIIAGCGRESSSTEGESSDTARFELMLTRTDREGRLVMSGTYDYAQEQGSMTSKLLGTEAAGTDVPNETRFFGDRYYSKEEFEGRTYWIGKKDEAGIGYPTEAIVPFPGSELDPSEAFDLILAAGEEEERGREEIRRVPTTRYRVEIDPKDLSRELNGRPLDEAVGPFAVDVWGDDDGRVRRIRVVEEETATMTYEFFDFGVDVDIERPPEDQIVTEEEFDKLMSGGGRPVSPDKVCEAPREDRTKADRFCLEMKEKP